MTAAGLATLVHMPAHGNEDCISRINALSRTIENAVNHPRGSYRVDELQEDLDRQLPITGCRFDDIAPSINGLRNLRHISQPRLLRDGRRSKVLEFVFKGTPYFLHMEGPTDSITQVSIPKQRWFQPPSL
jgi:hypothetical protein